MDIYIKNVPFSQTITLVQGAAIVDTNDLASITVKVRRLGSDSLLKTFSLAAGTITLILPASSGKITYSFVGSDTVDAKAGAYECEVVTRVLGQDAKRDILYTFILEEPYE